MRYRKKPDEAHALRYMGDNEDEIVAFLGAKHPHYGNGKQIMIPFGGNTGVMILSPGEWVVKDDDGCLTVVPDTAFRASWEEAP